VPIEIILFKSISPVFGFIWSVLLTLDRIATTTSVSASSGTTNANVSTRGTAVSIQQNIQHQTQQQHNLVQIPSNTQQLIPLDGLQMVDGQQVRIIQQPQNKLEGITTIFNRQNNQVEKVEIYFLNSFRRAHKQFK
jgi:hypothetical protein